jgi:primosomal protein N' (replication factor Y)
MPPPDLSSGTASSFWRWPKSGSGQKIGGHLTRPSAGRKDFTRLYDWSQIPVSGHCAAFATLATMPVLRLAINSPLRQLFDYLPPAGLKPEVLSQLRPGCRVMAPFGKRELCGILIEVADDTPIALDKLRPALAVLDHSPLISTSLLKLSEWAASYYKHPPGEILAAALPTALRSGQAHHVASETHWRLTTAGKGLPEGALGRAPRQAEFLHLLQNSTSISTENCNRSGVHASIRRQVEKKGLAESFQQAPPVLPGRCHGGPVLADEQAQAVAAIVSKLSSFSGFLLQGVTGSGKTEVYLRAIEQVLAMDRQALVLVPEIGLTPQIIERFHERFDAEIAVLHSGLAEGARYQAWEAARSGRANIVIGTRSAVFTSLARPGLIVIDEEHDLSFKQHEGFRYSARDLAVKRAQLEKIPVVLGSATPSLESLQNVATGKYQRLPLRQRVGGGRLPDYTLVDIRKRGLQGGLSQELLESTRQTLAAGSQVLLFLNRRGYAHSLQCHDCGYIADCRHCDAHLTLHRMARELRCHHCDWRQPLPRACPDCHSASLSARGVGTEQTEAVLRELFPSIPVYRVDRDSMQKRGAMEAVIASVHTGKPCILLGTQMLTKGHHFPGVTLVGLLDTDGALFSPDFRGPERMGQLLTQVGGRAGRADKPGRVILQTHYPDHPLLQALLGNGYGKYAELLLDQRQQTRLPPFGHILLMRAEATQLRQAEEFLQQIRSQTGADKPGAQFVGPLPAPMQRRSGRYRAQLLVNCRSRPQAQRIAEAMIQCAETLPAGKRIRWSLDVDPLDML